MKISNPAACPAPLSASPFLPRPDLVTQLNACAARLIVISAPAGCGKSMALLALARARAAAGRPCHWLRFAALAGAPEEGSLLIDEADFPTSPEAAAAALALIHARGRHQQIILALSGSLPAALRLEWIAGRLALFTARDLAFSPGEAAGLFGELAPSREVIQLCQMTEGWPLGLGLLSREGEAALALTRREGASLSLPRSLSQWFEDWLQGAGLNEALPMLMDLAVVQDFPAGVIAELPPSGAGPEAEAAGVAALQLLQRQGVFLRECGKRQGWLSLMPVFARFLRQRLLLRDPARAAQMRRFALEWSRAREDGPAMIRHGRQLWSAPEALAAVDASGGLTLSLGRGPDLDLPGPIRAGDALTAPLSFFAMIYERIRNGAIAEAKLHYTNASGLTRGFTRFESPVDPDLIRGWTDIFEAMFLIEEDRGFPADWYEAFEQGFRDAVSCQPVQAIAKSTVLVLLALDRGAREEALAVSQLALQLQEHVRADRVALFLELHRAQALIASARAAEAAEAVALGQKLAGHYSYADSYEMIICQVIEGLCAFENGDPARARMLLEPCHALLPKVHGWRRLWLDYYSAMAELLPEASGFWLDQGLNFARLRGGQQLAAGLRLLAVTCHLRAGDTAAAAAAWADLQPALTALLPRAGPQIRHLAGLTAADLALAQGDLQAARRALDTLDREALGAADLRDELRFLSLGIALPGQDSAALQPLLVRAVQLSCALPRLAADARIQSRLLGGCEAMIRAGLTPEAGLHSWYSARRLRPKTLLSPREQEIIGHIAEGLSTKEIARILGISEGTVKSHRKNLYEKLGVSARSRAIAKARELQLL